ncbi:hypothetical protein YPPY46_4462 [Yersinia pestis PY-46]|uniref:Uncharacterized protein n=1 Tax=Yersinia pestis PY-08 TaxID=992134 RepID=A0AB72ZDL5_YERPE|nr:hypothetical protein YPPY08_4572 [Yersinia pestis PY-08]EIR26411.1 hypothetical protein YPPY10_4559 [Yersinia pestis PY-10]EIR99114.1 hypothetical protein YPPY46_4462 [Yersinia pestis PY-46]
MNYYYQNSEETMLCVLRLYHWFILMRQGILTKNYLDSD